MATVGGTHILLHNILAHYMWLIVHQTYMALSSATITLTLTITPKTITLTAAAPFITSLVIGIKSSYFAATYHIHAFELIKLLPLLETNR